MVRKLNDKMTRDGFVEASSNRRLGKRVIHSDLTKKKLIEVEKLFETNAIDLDMKESVHKSSHPEEETTGNNHNDSSTCAGLHSLGSVVTCTRGRSEAIQNGSPRTESGITGRRENGNTPTSRIEPAVSTESFAPGAEDGRANGNTNYCNEMDPIMGSGSSQEKHSRKASTVVEPILQHTKRQKP